MIVAPSAQHFPAATPLTDAGVEAASRAATIIVATSGSFRVCGTERTVFIVGPRSSPITVGYLGTPNCRELRLPPWMGRALLDVPGRDLTGGVWDLVELPRTPFRDALVHGKPNTMEIARAALANWSTGRGRGDACLAAAAWWIIERVPGKSAARLAAHLGVSGRRLRQAMEAEAGLSVSALRRLVRHERATDLLRDGALPLAEVALAAGYADQSHLTRETVALAGVPPARLRRALASGHA